MKAYHRVAVAAALLLLACHGASAQTSLDGNLDLLDAQRSCKVKISENALSFQECQDCMRGTWTQGADKARYCMSLCQDQGLFSDTTGANECSTCIQSPRTTVNACQACVNSFRGNPSVRSNCFACMEINKGKSGHQDACVKCGQIPSAQARDECFSCLALGLLPTEVCVKTAGSKPPPIQLTVTPTSGNSIDAARIKSGLEKYLNAQVVVRSGAGNSAYFTVTLPSVAQVYASAAAIKNLLSTGHAVQATSLIQDLKVSEVQISGLREMVGMTFACGNSTTTAVRNGGWLHYASPSLCDDSSASANDVAIIAGRRQLKQKGSGSTGVSSSVDSYWQYMSYMARAASKPPLTAVTGCYTRRDGTQNFVAGVCLWGGKYVDAMRIYWSDGSEKLWGKPNNDGKGDCLWLDGNELISSIETQTGAWMDFIRFTTNFGKTLQMGKYGKPDPKDIKKAAMPPSSLVQQGQTYFNNGWSRPAVLTLFDETTLSGMWCGVTASSGAFINEVGFYFMLPIHRIEFAPTSVSVAQTGGSMAAEASATTTNMCPQGGADAGFVETTISSGATQTVSVNNQYSYSSQLKMGWSTSVQSKAGVKGIWSVDAKASYSGSYEVATATTSATSQSITTSTMVSQKVNVKLMCPDNVPRNTVCEWTFGSELSGSWPVTAWTTRGTYYMMVGSQFSRDVVGTTNGTYISADTRVLKIQCGGTVYYDFKS